MGELTEDDKRWFQETLRGMVERLTERFRDIEMEIVQALEVSHQTQSCPSSSC